MGITLIVIEVLTAILAVSFVMIIGIYKYNFSYWRRRKVLYVPNPMIPFGNITNLVKQKDTLPDLALNTYNFLKSNNAKHGGLYFFGRPIWMPVDLDLIRHVLVKDFSHFVNHGLYVNENDDPLTGHLFSLEDDNWRRMRAALNPTFTSGKIKMMFPIIAQNAKNLEDIIAKAGRNKETVDVKDYLSRFTIDVISSTAFGLEINSIQNPSSGFKEAGMRFFVDSGYEALRNLISFIVPRKYLIAMKFKWIKPDIADFFMDTAKKTVKYREENNIHRQDFIQLLIQLKNTGKVMNTGEAEGPSDKQVDMRISIEELAAQVFVFFIAGFETSATTSTFALLELSLNEDIQNKAREEVRSTLEKHNGQLTYEACMEMEYLERIIKETLRKYPPISMTPRLCTKDYRVPGSEVIIEKNTLVMIPVIGVQRDDEIYPDPDRFDPERFGENRMSIPNTAFLSFGEGPRICIGKRFGIIQTKVALATIIKDHKVEINREKTTIPIQFAPKSIVTTTKDGIWLNMTRIN